MDAFKGVCDCSPVAEIIYRSYLVNHRSGSPSFRRDTPLPLLAVDRFDRTSRLPGQCLPLPEMIVVIVCSLASIIVGSAVARTARLHAVADRSFARPLVPCYRTKDTSRSADCNALFTAAIHALIVLGIYTADDATVLQRAGRLRLVGFHLHAADIPRRPDQFKAGSNCL